MPVLAATTVERTRKSSLFEKKLQPWFLREELRSIMWAYKLSKYGHRDQQRESGERYFEHPKAVATIIPEELKIFDAQSIIMALLHDIIEDSYLLDEDLMRRIFGKMLTNGVRLLSKDENVKPVYYERLRTCGNWRVILVKICDRLHNMRTLDTASKEKQRKQAKETRKEFFALCDLLAELIPKKHYQAVPYLRDKLDALCIQYGA
jgi:GTP diphosphokinase / guanosine-3',5'-bis(diphosphate) 3'-diphosphatase